MNLSDIILQQVTKNVAGSNIQIPQNLQQQVLGGLSDSILGSLAKTATAPGGLEQIKGLLTGQADAAKSPVTALAGNIFRRRRRRAPRLHPQDHGRPEEHHQGPGR